MNHQLLLRGVALRHQQCNRRERIIVDLHLAVRFQMMPIALQEPDEHKRTDAFVAVRKRMIFDDRSSCASMRPLHTARPVHKIK